MSPNRIVAVYTPFVFAPLAGFIAAWLAAHVPGVNIAQDQLWVVFVVGMLSALAVALQWLHGWQMYEERMLQREDLALRLATVEGTRAARAMPEPALADDVGDLLDDDFDDFDEVADEEEFADADFEFDEPMPEIAPQARLAGPSPAD
jgi:hypothetical protein